MADQQRLERKEIGRAAFGTLCRFLQVREAFQFRRGRQGAVFLGKRKVWVGRLGDMAVQEAPWPPALETSPHKCPTARSQLHEDWDARSEIDRMLRVQMRTIVLMVTEGRRHRRLYSPASEWTTSNWNTSCDCPWSRRWVR